MRLAESEIRMELRNQEGAGLAEVAALLVTVAICIGIYREAVAVLAATCLARKRPFPAKCGSIRRPTGSPRWLGIAMRQCPGQCLREADEFNSGTPHSKPMEKLADSTIAPRME